MLLKTLIASCLIFLLFTAAHAQIVNPPTAMSNTSSIVGTWQGSLDVSGIKLRLALKIKQADGKLSATLDSLDQGANDVPVNSITQDNAKVAFEIQVIGAKYEGELSADGQEIKGTFTQGAALPLTFKRGEKPATLNRPQTPQPPFPYDAEEVTYQNKTDNLMLAGTLTIPREAGKSSPAPAVILITGSGPQDRDETLFGHKPFWVLADYLTRRGIAVLRVDDRGTGKSTGNFFTATTEDFARDVASGIEFLKTHARVNPKKIGLIGHSEGGIVAPLVAANNQDVAFIVLMAGTGLTGEEILYAQSALIMQAGGASPEQIKRNRELQRQSFVIVKAESEAAQREKRLREAYTNFTSNMTDAEKKSFPEGTLEANIKMTASAWFKFFLTYDPRTTLKKVRVPVLAINGEKDLQVPAKDNLQAIERALKAGGNKDVTVLELPRLNHLFQTSTTGAVQEYGQLEETFSPVALKVIGDWIAKRTGGK